jgi:hypothetical protein
MKGKEKEKRREKLGSMEKYEKGGKHSKDVQLETH